MLNEPSRRSCVVCDAPREERPSPRGAGAAEERGVDAQQRPDPSVLATMETDAALFVLQTAGLLGDGAEEADVGAWIQRERRRAREQGADGTSTGRGGRTSSYS